MRDFLVKTLDLAITLIIVFATLSGFYFGGYFGGFYGEFSVIKAFIGAIVMFFAAVCSTGIIVVLLEINERLNILQRYLRSMDIAEYLSKIERNTKNIN